MQARGGRIEITKARVQQGEVIAVSTGTLGLTERGNLDGQLQMTVVGIEHVLKALDLEAIVSQGRVGATIDKLDRLMPGLGNIARKNAGARHPRRPRRDRQAHDAGRQAGDQPCRCASSTGG